VVPVLSKQALEADTAETILAKCLDVFFTMDFALG